jgi:hypothetical protein
MRLLAAALALVMTAAAATACPFCSAQGTTLSGEVAEADFIVLGRMVNPRRDPTDITKGETDLVIDSVVKPLVPRYVPVDPAAKDAKFIVFCKLYTPAVYTAAAAVASGALLADTRITILDAYRGEPVEGKSNLADYLKGAIAVRDKPTPDRLHYFFKYLDAPDLVISTDAMNEFAAADYPQVRAMSKTLPAEKVLSWIKDPNTPQSRLGLYGLFIGHCGKPADAVVLRQLLDGTESRFIGGLDGVLAAYTLLDPKAGVAYLDQLIADPKSDFQVRYAVYKVFTFLWDYRQDIVKPDAIVAGMLKLMAIPDMSDLPMETLRKWGRWELTDTVLGYTKVKSHNDVPIVRRAILKFAIAAPATKAEAKAYVESVRKDDPDRVKYVEQTLQDELAPAKK